MRDQPPNIAVVIPCYRVRDHILQVLADIGDECQSIYVVDDACPEGTGDFVSKNCGDPRVKVIRHTTNQGVGGAVITGYHQAISDGADIIVKIDGDGQHDPKSIKKFAMPIAKWQADYTKGNRFYNIENLKGMPRIRILGNAVLSFLSKLSTGYWDLFDPTNGYTAINAKVAAQLPLLKISHRFFFESDMLFRLSTIRAVVVDIPMPAIYGDEVSNLHPHRIITEFFSKHARNFGKRIFYNYFLRDMSLATFQLLFGLFLFMFGLSFGTYHWLISVENGLLSSAGTVMLAALPIILGIQFLLSFFGYDIAITPRTPLCRTLDFDAIYTIQELTASLQKK